MSEDNQSKRLIQRRSIAHLHTADSSVVQNLRVVLNDRLDVRLGDSVIIPIVSYKARVAVYREIYPPIEDFMRAISVHLEAEVRREYQKCRL